MGNGLRKMLAQTKADFVAQQRDVSVEPVAGQSAFVAVLEAECRYEPCEDAPVSMAPPYGTEVFVENTCGEWALVQTFAKKAWTECANLSRELPAPIPEWLNYVGGQIREVSPDRGPNSVSVDMPGVEVGPRGGRFVRTKGGFRSYF